MDMTGRNKKWREGQKNKNNDNLYIIINVDNLIKIRIKLVYHDPKTFVLRGHLLVDRIWP